MPMPTKNESKQDYLKRCTSEVIAEGKDAQQAYAMCNAYWDNDKGQRSSLNLSLPVELKEGEKEGDAKKFLITAYTGQPVQRLWGGNLTIDVEGIKTKKKIPVLREHARDRVVGYGASWTADNNLYIQGNFSKRTADGKEVLELAEEGYPWQASIGVSPTKVKTLEKEQKLTVNGNEIEGPAEIWTESKVGEVSFVSLGADDETAAISFSDDKVNIKLENDSPQNTQGEIFMELTIDNLKADAPELLEQITNEAFGEGEVAERNRVIEILEADGDFEVSLKCIKEGLPASEVFKMLFKAEKAKMAEKLEELETQAPEPVGSEEPEVKEEKFIGPADEELAKLAIALMDKDKTISYELALKQVRKENPELDKAYRESYVA